MENIIIDTNIYDKSNMVTNVIEVNYKTARVLLLSDLNSNVPVSIAPQNIQAIITGSGDNYGEIKYIKAGVDNKFNEKSIVYTSGTGALFKSGIPIGRIIINKNNEEKNKFKVEFYSNFSQLKYVFAEVISKKKVIKSNLENNQNDNSSKNPIETKLKILEDEKKIIGDINLKFREENETLKTKNNYLNTAISELKNKVFFSKKGNRKI